MKQVSLYDIKENTASAIFFQASADLTKGLQDPSVDRMALIQKAETVIRANNFYEKVTFYDAGLEDERVEALRSVKSAFEARFVENDTAHDQSIQPHPLSWGSMTINILGT